MTGAQSAVISPTAECAWCDAPLRDAPATAGRARCPRCGVWNAAPVPSAKGLDAAYPGWYRPPGGRFAGPGDRLLRRSRAHLGARLDRIAPPGPILDVGAGDGALLDALAARGRVAVGIERQATHPNVRAIDPAGIEGRWAGRRWAGIVLWHSLEHLPGAGRALDHLAAVLEPSGVLVIAMPNAASLQAAAFGDRWFALDVPRHLIHVPVGALLGRLEALGLRLERVSHLRGGQAAFGWLHGMVGRLPGHPDLYDAIRRPAARRTDLSGWGRAGALATAAALLPLAVALAGLEAAAGRGGSIYVEARRV
jgi:hypothetical protein